ncbi:hypothetical protein BMF94_4719 [Rhodotorula taiwanensis]|uniref:Uncharacterized protein n=1 Tax=Rhodotorula taiwanensis TaxID=741276 RepID=A0A2S5B5Z5_9BASI|nr:hypothetical protein BMF94_4719 [Rhodotorula taiwanensis]
MASKGEQYKQQGNAAFLKGQLALALASYTTAIQLDPSVAAYPLNRAAVYLKQSEWVRAEKDATTALELDGGNNVKALYRRATARRHTGKLELAQQDLEQAKSQGGGADVDKELAIVLELRGTAKSGTNGGTTQPVNGKEGEAAPSQQNGNSRLSSDRLRAALAEPSSAAAPPSSSSTSTAGLMNAVSTRRLKPTAASAATSPIANDSKSAANGGVNSFAAKKEARLAKHRPVIAVAESGSRQETALVSKPNVTAADQPSPAAAPPVASTSTRPQSLSPTRPPRSVLVATPPSAAASTLLYHTAATSFPTALEAHFLAHPQRGDPVRLAAVRELAQRYPASAARRSPRALTEDSKLSKEPSTLRDWMGPAGLTPDLLSELLAEVDALYPPASASTRASIGDHEGDLDWVVELLEALPTCQRWDSASLFLATDEKKAVMRVLDRAKARLDRISTSWGV